MISQLLTALNANRPANATEGSNTLPNPEQMAAIQRALAEGGGEQGSAYFDLRPRSRTKLVNPAPSKYAEMKKKDENKK